MKHVRNPSLALFHINQDLDNWLSWAERKTHEWVSRGLCPSHTKGNSGADKKMNPPGHQWTRIDNSHQSDRCWDCYWPGRPRSAGRFRWPPGTLIHLSVLTPAAKVRQALHAAHENLPSPTTTSALKSQLWQRWGCETAMALSAQRLSSPTGHKSRLYTPLGRK